MGGMGIRQESMNVVAVVLDVRNDGRKFFAKEVRVEKGSDNGRVPAVKTGRKSCGFFEDKVTISPFALDVPTSSKCIRLKVEMAEKGIPVAGIHRDVQEWARQD